jgi:hypothetical protein
LKLLGVTTDELEHGLEIFEIEQQQAIVVCDFEGERENSGLGIVQIQNTA